jgi:uncharacterized membrane protein YesL
MTTEVNKDSQVRSEKKTSLLTKVLRADGVFALVSGAVLILAAGPIAGLIELSFPLALAIAGVLFIGYGALLLYFAGREPENRRVARIAIVLNVLWAIGSYAGVIFGWFPVNSAGNWAIILAAEAVIIFAILEFVALRRLEKEVTA